MDVPPTEWFLSMKKGDSPAPGNPKVVYRAGAGLRRGCDPRLLGLQRVVPRAGRGWSEFKRNLGDYLGKQLAANYSGHGAPRIVLFSPIAQENMRDPDFSDGAEKTTATSRSTRRRWRTSRKRGTSRS